MAWANQHIKNLVNGGSVQFRPHGDSMTGKINSGQLCTVEPVTQDTNLNVGDVVLCKVKGSQYLHFIKSIQARRYQIGNNHGRINGWIDRKFIFGILTCVE